MSRLGANTAVPVHTTVAVATSSGQLLAANANRSKLIMSNVGANNIYVRMDGGVASATTGILIAPGATLIDDLGVSPLAITAIAATGATNLVVVEYTQ
jgi:hypothetical protein